MYEIEIKAYCDDITKVETAAQQIGAQSGADHYQRDIYFNHPARDFRESDEVFRIRQVDEEYHITYKGPKLSSKTKTRKEYEVAVGDFETTRNIVESLGFVESGIVEKKRKEYFSGGITICLDRVTGLGNFVELEKIGEDVEKTETELFALAEKLGLKRFESRSYLNLLMGE